MRIVDVRGAAGSKLGAPVRGDDGRVLLAAGVPLTPGLCEALYRRGFSKVQIADGVADDIHPEDALKENTRRLAMRAAQDCFRHVEGGHGVPLKGVINAVEAIMQDLGNARDVALDFATLRTASQHTYVHSVQVCVYSLLVGQMQGLAPDEMRVLGVGALLHDVGQILCADLCSKPSPLSAEQWVRVRQHPIDGFEMLRHHRDLHLYAAHVAYQHHERLDGSGYPRGLTASRILPFAKIVAVTEAFDSMTSDRPYAPARSRLEATAELMAGSGSLFDPSVVTLMLQRLALYPSGVPVMLADGTVAAVAQQTDDPAHPLVRCIGRAGQMYRDAAPVRAEGGHAITQVLDRWPRWVGDSLEAQRSAGA